MIEISKAKIKQVIGLRRKKTRMQLNSYVVEGRKLCHTLIDAGSPIHYLITTDAEYRAPQGVQCYSATLDIMKSISSLDAPSDMLAVLPMTSPIPISSNSPVLIALDRIQDPGNVGTIIRSADWFGLHDMILLKGCADVYNSKTLQAAMGSHLTLRWAIMDQADFIQSYAHYKRILFDTSGQFMQGFSLDTNEKYVFLFGNEGQGVSAQLQAQSTSLAIPGHAHRAAESLNVASAAAIAFHWIRLQLG